MSSNAAFEIQQLLARSSDCVWRKDAEHYGRCWSINGEWRILGMVTVGREAIKTAWWQFMDPLQSAWQVSQNIVLEIGERQAHGRVYITETLRLADGTVQITQGIYHDSYVVEDGSWVFGRRHFDLTYMGPPDMSGRFFPTVPYGPAPENPAFDRPATPSMQEAYGA